MTCCIRFLSIVIGLILILPGRAISQINFVKVFDERYYEYMTNIIQTRSNHFLMSGIEVEKGDVFAYVIKADSKGNLVWAKRIGPVYRGLPGINSKMIEISDGFIFLSSVFQSGHPVLYKIDEEGNVIWARALNGPPGYYPLSMAHCADGGFIIAGAHTTKEYFHNDIKGSLYEITLIKTDAAGNEQWQRNYGAVDQDVFASSVLECSDGGFMVAGSTTEGSSIDIFLENILVFKTDATGNVLFRKIVGGEEQNIALRMIRTMDGKYVISVAENTSNYLSMMKFTEAGEVIWYKQVIGPQAGIANTLAMLHNGDFVLSGESQKEIGQVTVWIVSSEGNLIKETEHVIAAGKPGRSDGITVASDGDPVLTGSFDYLHSFIMKIGADGCLMKDISLGDDKESCGEEVLLKVTKGFTSYQWSTGAQSDSISANKSGTYVVTVENEDHCFRKDSVQVTFKNCILRDNCKKLVYNAEDLFVPNVITPNEDDKNEYFKVGDNILGSALNVFNRYGSLVYHSDKYNNDWNGGDLSTGIYYYVIQNTCFSKPIKGNLSIVR